MSPGQVGQRDPVDPPVAAAAPAQHLGYPEDIVMAVLADRHATQPGTRADHQAVGLRQRADRLGGRWCPGTSRDSAADRRSAGPSLRCLAVQRGFELRNPVDQRRSGRCG